MKWLTNIYNPDKEDAKRYHIYDNDMDRDIQWQLHLKWLSDKYIGKPKATDTYSQSELIAMNCVGVYADET